MSLNKNEKIYISVGIVFRNEALRINRLIEEIHSSMPSNIVYEVIGYDNNSNDNSAITFKAVSEALNISSQLIISDMNNMGLARDSILKNAKQQLVLFIDCDVSVTSSGLNTLFLDYRNSANENKISAWSGPLIISDKNDFQKMLRLIQNTWFGNFGSAQMKIDISSKNIYHAPTAFLLLRKSIYLDAGSFDKRLSITGEDLEVHLRLVKNGYHIRWVSKASAYHDVATAIVPWLKKCVKYGLAQTQIAKIHRSFWFSKKCLPIWLLLFMLILATISIKLFFLMLALYFLMILITAFNLNKKRTIYLIVILIFTHFGYLIGELWGIFKKLDNSTIEK